MRSVLLSVLQQLDVFRESGGKRRDKEMEEHEKRRHSKRKEKIQLTQWPIQNKSGRDVN